MKKSFLKKVLSVVGAVTLSGGIILSSAGSLTVYAEEPELLEAESEETEQAEDDETDITVFETKAVAEIEEVPEVSADEENSEEKVSVQITASQDLSRDPDGGRISFTATVLDASGEAVQGAKTTIYVKKPGSGFSKISSNYLNASAVGIYEYYAEYAGDDIHESAVSDTASFEFSKFTSLKGYIKSTPSPEGEELGTIVVSSDYPDFDKITVLEYYSRSNTTLSTTEGTVIDRLAADTYYVKVPARADGEHFYKTSGNQSVTVDEGEAIARYDVRAEHDERVNWTRDYFEYVSGTERTYVTKVTPVDETRYYIENVVADPVENAVVNYNAGTGLVEISNVTGNVTLKAQVIEKAVPTTIELIETYVLDDAIYSEENPSIRFFFDIKVLDQNGNVVPGAVVYFKDDASEVSFTNKIETDADGLASVFYAYGIEEGSSTADYKAVFAFDNEFSIGVTQKDIHLVLQKKSDLVLYTDQIIAAEQDKNNGKVINVPDEYEIWTGDVHEYAIVLNSGTWQKAVDHEFTDLSAGTHLIRIGQHFDKDTATVYLHSDYDYFEVPKGSTGEEINDDPETPDEPESPGESESPDEPEQPEKPDIPCWKPVVWRPIIRRVVIIWQPIRRWIISWSPFGHWFF